MGGPIPGQTMSIGQIGVGGELKSSLGPPMPVVYYLVERVKRVRGERKGWDDKSVFCFLLSPFGRGAGYSLQRQKKAGLFFVSFTTP